MFKIKVLNNISETGLRLLPADKYEISPDVAEPDAVLVRSANMLEMEMPPNLKAIARAGAGVNNIPLDRCTQRGIVVFNTPGANANAVKELVLTSIFLSSRRICRGIDWVQSLKGKGAEVTKLVEKGKSQFEGPEVRGKKLGVIGLGAIGSMVANEALALGMEVMGYDPYISVEAAWGLSRSIIRITKLEQLLASSDYVTIHMPQDDNTRGMFNREKFEVMKKGIRIINLARGGLVINADILEAIENGTVACYVTDFPEDELLGNDRIIAIPHLGASTPESEENCAVMAVNQLKAFLEQGNIINSVNFPRCELPRSGNTRLITAHLNIPNMVGQVTTVLAASHINIAGMLTHHKESIGYNVIDIDGKLTQGVLDSIRQIEGVKMVRVINGQ